ncbi:hypothetical protein FRC01_001040 [Tulasnella sp. 417]|nr:hypothetical protein FRC01_001040 [Tulasnella sp. 417]
MSAATQNNGLDVKPAGSIDSHDLSAHPLQSNLNLQQTPTSDVIPPSPSSPSPVDLDIIYHASTSFTRSSVGPSSGPSPYFSPPVSWLPAHMRRGQKSSHGSQSPSMLQECFSADNSPAYDISHLTPRTELDSLRGREPDFSNSSLFNGQSRLKGAPATWTDQDGAEVKFPSLVAWHLTKTCNPKDAENALSDLLRATAKEEIDQNWIQTLRSSESLLLGLFRLADMVTPAESLLNPKSPCAKVIDLLLKDDNVDDILTQVHRSDMGGATALRYLICKARSIGSPPGESYDTKPKNPWTPEIAVLHACRIADWSGVDSLGMIPAIRLVESALASVHTLDRLQQSIYRIFLEAVIQLIKHQEHVRLGERQEIDPARRIAALHLVSSTLRKYKSILDRLEGEADTPTMPDKEWILQDIGISDIVPYLRDEESHPLVRCMALRVLRDFANADADEVPRWEQLEDILTICVDVLLWQTKWQHGHEDTSKSLDIAKFCPHDDAYRVIILSPAELVIPILSRSLKAVDNIALLEPLMSLIVDHSRLQDRYWPFMLSMLFHSGCLSVFHGILLRPSPEETDLAYRTTCRAKAEACIGLTRCFEQMRARDVMLVPSNIAPTLTKLANNEKLPSTLRGRASDAFGTLRGNLVTSYEIRSQVLTHLDYSAGKPSNPNSASSLKYQSKHAGPLAHMTRESRSAKQPIPEAVPIQEEPESEGLDRPRPDPRAKVIQKGILKKHGVVFPEPDAVAASPYPPVKSHRNGGGYGGYEPAPPQPMYAGYRTPGPSSQPLPLGMMTPNLASRPGAPEPWAHAPQDFQPPTAPRAASPSASKPPTTANAAPTSPTTSKMDTSTSSNGGSSTPERPAEVPLANPPGGENGHPDPSASDPEALREQGNFYFKEKEYDVAIDLYSQAIAQRPDPTYYSNRAAAYIARKKFKLARDDIQTAFSLQSEAPSAKTLALLAQCHLALGDGAAFQVGAAAVASPRTTVSVFDKDFKTPRTIFDPISSDQDSIYDPNSPNKHSQSLSDASLSPQFTDLPEGEDDDDDPEPYVSHAIGGSSSVYVEDDDDDPEPYVPHATGGSSSGFVPPGARQTTSGSASGFAPPGVPQATGGSSSPGMRTRSTLSEFVPSVQRMRDAVQSAMPTLPGYHQALRKTESVMSKTPRVSVHSITDEDEPKAVPVAPPRELTPPPPPRSPPRPVRKAKGKGKKR